MKKTLLLAGVISSSLSFAQVTTGSNSYTNTSYVGSSAASTEKAIFFRTNNVERMRLTSTGILGIGTLNPHANSGVHIHQKLLFLTGNNSYGGPQIVWGNSETDGGQWGLEYNAFSPGYEGLNFWRVGGGNYYMFLHNSGRVGINTNNPTAQLTVNGNVLVGDPATISLPAGYKLYVQTGILTEKVKVALESTSDWADYVFEQNYKLLDLRDVKSFIKENSHLPGIPSAQELVDDKGYDLSKMDAKLLEKIEELTLYMIQLSEENAALKERVNLLENK